MDFIAEFKRRMAKVDYEANPIKDLKESQVKAIQVPWDTELYSVYKRSLPVKINYPVLMNLPLEDAKRAIRRLKTKDYTDPDGGKHAIYYDMVLQSDPRQKSVFWNDRPTTKEGGINEDVQILRGNDKYQETWLG